MNKNVQIAVDVLHGIRTCTHGIHGFQIHVCVLDGEHLCLERHSAAHDLVDLLLVLLLALERHDGHPLVLCGILLGEDKLGVDFGLQVNLALLEHRQRLSEPHNGVFGRGFGSLGLEEEIHLLIFYLLMFSIY